MKEHPRLTLGEDFAQEKSWQWEDITVLTARLTLPQTKGESRREKRFDRYYRALADAYFARCEQKLLPDAAKTCRAAMARSAPWQMTAVTLTYRVSAQTEDAVVFTFEVNDGEGVLRRWEEGWECARSCRFLKRNVVPRLQHKGASAVLGTRRARKGEQPEGAASLVLPQRAGVRSKGAILSRERMAPLNPQENARGVPLDPRHWQSGA